LHAPLISKDVLFSLFKFIPKTLFQSKELQEKYDTTVQKLEECQDLLKTNENGRSESETYLVT